MPISPAQYQANYLNRDEQIANAVGKAIAFNKRWKKMLAHIDPADPDSAAGAYTLAEHAAQIKTAFNAARQEAIDAFTAITAIP